MQFPIVGNIVANRFGLFWFVVLSGSLFGFLILLLFLKLPITYAAFGTFGLLFPFVALIMGDTKRLLWAALAICLPITVDITINHTGHIGGPAGYIISFFDIILIFLYLMWFVESIKNKKNEINLLPRISIPAFLLILCAILSFIPSNYPNYSFFGLIEVLKMYFAFFYLANNLKNKSDILFLLSIFILSLLFEGLLGWAQHRYDEPFFPTALGGPSWIDSRVKGTWVSYNDFAWYLTFFLPLSMSMLFSKIKPTYKIVCFFALSAGSASLIWTKSRASWISFVVAALFVVLLVLPKINTKKALVKTFLAIIGILILILPLYPRLYNKMYWRFAGPDRGSAASRIPQFKIAYNIIKDNPILGVGLNTYSERMWEYDDTEIGLGEITRHPVHNIFLHIAAEIGIFGLMAFLWLMASIFYSGLKYVFLNQDVMAYFIIGLLAGLLAHLVHGLVDTESIGGKLFMFMWVFAGIILAITKIKTDEESYSVNRYSN